MEKFTDYRDAYTGLHPFLPLKTPPSLVVSSVVFLLRLPALLVFLPVILALDALLRPVAPVRRVVNWLLVRAFFVLSGFLSVADMAVGRPAPGRRFVVSNHKSYVDLLYLAAQHGATCFCHVRSADDVVVHHTLWSAVRFIVGDRFSTKVKGAPISCVGNLAGTVVLFVEGSTTNHERGVLQPGALPELDQLQLDFKCVLISYSNKSVPFLGLPDQSLLRHLVDVFGTPTQSIKGYVSDKTDDTRRSWDKVVNASRFKQFKVSHADKMRFLTAWKKRKNI